MFVGGEMDEERGERGRVEGGGERERERESVCVSCGSIKFPFL